MTTKEMIAVMQAYEDGKKIQVAERNTYRNPDRNENDWVNVVVEPMWDWYRYEYRIKPESKYVPYDNVSEVDRNKWIVTKTGTMACQIEATNTFDDTVYIVTGGWKHLDTLFKDYTYEDGSPCGKLVKA